MTDEATRDRMTDSLARLCGVLFTEESLDTILELIVSLAVESVDPAGSASVSLRRSGAETTAAASSERALALDAAQYRSGRGPCLTSSRTGETVECRVEPGDGRWPEFAATASEGRVGYVIAAPLRVDGEPAGALNVYFDGSEGPGEHQLRALRLLAEQASVVVSNAVAFTRAEKLNDQLEDALATRETIGQAKGIIMATQRVDAQEAFDILRRSSQRSNRKLREVALDVVESARSIDS